ncbi:DUF4920 domain-containing protein [Pseudoalteromonas sp. L23]|uniref:DUF4920 domain-containing protein n=1 Tax=unclassified Pseudoalteromonas TaxID=194690 RepID=UPI001EEF9C0F|nr:MULTISPECIES: DUF4920 domain-containing protein [unclassified Pseudoalteromonas]MCF7512433.1 DUF4920 domain-containing protein [Pseudoalteromonas sp. L7]MCF7524353.1 DUF4920 domain-containing protein [Pseudoalteromonas sp. L23]MCX2768274.1 DUF4920 domain-containing protein [Pseudoalteromonas sp. B530]
MKINNLLCGLVITLLVSTADAKTIEFGGGANMNKLVAAADVLKNSEQFTGSEITLSGEVVKVCKKRGCWMTLKVDNGEEINVKVRDGDMVFPMSAIGKRAYATGVLERFELDIEKTKRYLAHRAHENGEAFDASKVTEGMSLVRLKPDAVTILETK